MNEKTQKANQFFQKAEDSIKRNKKTIIISGIIFILCLVFLVSFLSVERYDYFTPLNEEQIDAIVARNEEIPYKREVVIDAALSIVGDVPYFWGGKSDALGFDPQWGQMKEVTSAGSVTTGTIEPYGLDCSGMISWAFIQTGMTWDEMADLIGNGTKNQWEKSVAIEWDELMPGDLVFQYEPGNEEGNHVGICIGFTKWGEPIFVHAAKYFDNVVVTPAGDIFQYARRPLYYYS